MQGMQPILTISFSALRPQMLGNVSSFFFSGVFPTLRNEKIISDQPSRWLDFFLL